MISLRATPTHLLSHLMPLATIGRLYRRWRMLGKDAPTSTLS